MKLLLVLLLAGTVLGCRRKKVEVLPPAPVPAEEAQAPSSPSAVSQPAIIPAAPLRPAGAHPGEPANATAVRTAYHQYFEKMGNFPNGWPDMVQRKFLPAVPQGKNGQPLDFVQFTLWEASQPAR